MKNIGIKSSLGILIFLVTSWPAFSQDTGQVPSLCLETRDFNFGKVNEGSRLTYRVSEINRLTWDDVHFKERYISLCICKKKGGNLKERKVHIKEKLFEILSQRYQERYKTKPWKLWHRYWSRKEKRFKEGPYKDRKKFMKTLCKNAGVPYFRFHPLRHSGASVMDGNNVTIGSIQRILGHENRRTTEIYLHGIGNAEREAMARFEEPSINSHTESHIKKKRS